MCIPDIEFNSTKRDVLELDYSRLMIGVVNTSIAWRYSSLTCQPSVFIIEGYAGREEISNNTPTVTLNSTSTEIRLPTMCFYTNGGALYLRLLAYNELGDACAQHSAVHFYKLEKNSEIILVACVVIYS